MRVALLGGTFDPPHVGHLLAATDASEHLQADQLVFIPAAQQPLKRNQAASSAEHRVRMLELMVAGNPGFSVDRVEIDRTGLSFTVDTLDHFARAMPNAERFFLMGEDAWATFGHWREPARVAELAQLVVLTRSVGRDTAPFGQDTVAQRVLGEASPRGPGPVFLATRRVDVSSTEVRERVRAGLSIHGFVTESVAAYIATNGLYR